MTIYDGVGEDQTLADNNEYRLEEYSRSFRKGKVLITVTNPVLRIYVLGERTDAMVEIEPDKGAEQYARLRMSSEDRQALIEYCNKTQPHVH